MTADRPVPACVGFSQRAREISIMKIDRDRFLEEGYLTVREAIPPSQLEEVREAYELLVGCQREIWARERKPDDCSALRMRRQRT